VLRDHLDIEEKRYSGNSRVLHMSMLLHANSWQPRLPSAADGADDGSPADTARVFDNAMINAALADMKNR
jgi:hypothetical protein